MYGLLNGATESAPTRSAQAVVTALMSSLGSAGLRAATEQPRLLASLDQHAAAIRDSLATAEGGVSLAALAGYAEGIHAGADAHGWRPAAIPVNWSDIGEDWVLLRLLAVCSLARSLDAAPSVG